MKEKWTVEFIVEYDENDNYLWDHMKENNKVKPHLQIYNGDDGLRELFEDGIHWHTHCTCYKEFDWKLVKKEII